ncbi:MAG: hypothetical protein PHN88_01245 [Ignavibacteria bacterium]|nr:hypothetical protein [Ignavibacteria bacterium]
MKTLGLIILTIAFIELTSCSRVAKESLTDEQKVQLDSNTVVSTIDQKDITETDEDLSTVDYKEFYDQLAPYGEWVEVNAAEIGVKVNTTSLKTPNNNDFTISNILGIKTAYADASAGMIFVWRPSPEFAVVGSSVESPQYTPYNNGQWVNTDAGWYFRAPTAWEETVHHHGRWVRSPDAGWMWVPGRVWAPAWVDWRQDDEYVSWAPLGPSSYFNSGKLNNSRCNDDDYYIVERKHFIDPDIYRYSSPYYESGNRIPMNLMIGTAGLVYTNDMIVNRGPDVNIIQKYYTSNINVVNINHVRNFNEVRYTDRQFNVYSPNFKKYKDKNHPGYRKNEPKSYQKFDEWKGKNKDFKNNDNGFKNENKGNDNGNKNRFKENERHNKGNEDVKQNKRNENVTKHKGNKNITKHKESNNVTKQKSSNTENRQKRNQDVRQNKSRDNGNQQKSNGNVRQNKGNNTGKEKK